MIPTPALLKALAFLSGAGSLVAILSMFTQVALSGTTPEAIWWSRIIAWWVDFFIAGCLLMLAVYLWRKSERLTKLTVPLRPRLRVALFILGHILLTGGLYFSDFAWYLRHRDIANIALAAQAEELSAASWILFAVAFMAFWYAWAHTGNRAVN